MRNLAALDHSSDVNQGDLRLKNVEADQSTQKKREARTVQNSDESDADDEGVDEPNEKQVSPNHEKKSDE